MTKNIQITKITKWIKLFTYISAVVLLLTNNRLERLAWLIPLVLLVFFINYSREYYLEAMRKPMKYIVASVTVEMLLIICIGFLDKTDINILFFFVLVSANVIIYPFIYSVPLAAFFVVSGLFVYAARNGFADMANTIAQMFFSYGVSTTFVIGMSYLVKLQIHEREKLSHINSELEQAYKRLIENSAMAQKLTVEQERTRMAREIHDTLAHTLTNLIVQLEACRKLAVLAPEKLPAELEKAQELSRSGFNDVKRSIKALRPQVMENKSLFASIISIINETMANTNVHINFNNYLPHDISLESSTEIALFRAIQESITNSIRHGQARVIDITFRQEENKLQLMICDNGIGCSSIKKGFGIKGIRERIEALNGSADFTGSYGKGFKTRIEIPYEVA